MITNTQKKVSFSCFLASLLTWSKSSYETVRSLRETAKYLSFPGGSIGKNRLGDMMWGWRGGEGEVYRGSSKETYIAIRKRDSQQEFAI